MVSIRPFLFLPLEAGRGRHDPPLADEDAVAHVLAVLVEGDVPGPVAVQGRARSGVI